ncbi:MAG TPA: ATP-binding protein [Actinomycetota bacterium]
MTDAERSWTDWNQAVLGVEVAAVRAHVERFAGSPDGSADQPPPDPVDGWTSALDAVSRVFGLSRFERSLLVLCAGIEIDPALAQACGRARGDGAPHATFGVGLAALPDPHWSAIAPGGPLRLGKLLEVETGSLTTATVRVDERVLHYLLGIDQIDQRIAPLLQPLSERVLLDRHHELAHAVASAFASRGRIVHLLARDRETACAVVAAAAALNGSRALSLAAAALPREQHELTWLASLWSREAALSQAVLLVELDAPGPEAEDLRRARQFVEQTQAPCVVRTATTVSAPFPAALGVEVTDPEPEERHALWDGMLVREGLTADVDRLVAQFNLSADAVHDVCAEVALTAADATDATDDLWTACKRRARPKLDALAHRIQPKATWDDLVLPPAQRAVLQETLTHVHHRWRVYQDWGFADRDTRGFGITCLFVGPSGTGKTMAAEVLARALDLDCYRIDLSQVVSKYIGETEKNLARVFDAAEDGGSVLLFDEADALFGKRSEVRDSHDRYANVEISYLLQRMEEYRGLAILTTNMRSALDQAFLRRIRFVVEFPFPSAVERAEIWRRMFPPRMSLAGLDMDALARINATGGTIRNIAVAAAFRAAAANVPLETAHVFDAAQVEFAKLEHAASVGGRA